MRPDTVVTGVIGGDCHVVGNWMLTYALSNAGFRVVKLGVMVPQEDFINAAIESDACAILVSSLYGHAPMDCIDFRAKCDEAGLNGILLYLGGNLAMGKRDWAEIERSFKDMGFDRVYSTDTLPETAIADLRQDIAGLSLSTA